MLSMLLKNDCKSVVLAYEAQRQLLSKLIEHKKAERRGEAPPQQPQQQQQAPPPVPAERKHINVVRTAPVDNESSTTTTIDNL